MLTRREIWEKLRSCLREEDEIDVEISNITQEHLQVTTEVQHLATRPYETPYLSLTYYPARLHAAEMKLDQMRIREGELDVAKTKVTSQLKYLWSRYHDDQFDPKIDGQCGQWGVGVDDDSNDYDNSTIILD
jgi:hypothetical protein